MAAVRGGGCPPQGETAAATCDVDASSVADALASNALAALVPRRSIVWDYAVAQAVTAMGAIVKDYIDVSATRIPPTYDAVMGALRYWGFHSAVPGFQAEWEELCSTPDGRAVVAVCEAAAAGDALLGRLHLTLLAEDPDLEDKLKVHYKDAAYLPVLLAAARYYRDQYAPPAIEAASPAWPSLAAMLPDGLLDHAPLPRRWLVALAPALTALERIVTPYITPATAVWLLPTYNGIVKKLQNMGLDALVPSFDAAWVELRGTREGCAVIAVCKAARDAGILLGRHNMPEVAASVPDLADALRKEFAGEEFLPVLLAAAHYYGNQTAAMAAAAAVAGGAGVAASAGGAGSFE